MTDHKIMTLKKAVFPKMFGNLIHTNQLLKYFSIMSFTISMICLIAVLVLINKEPIILTMDINAKLIEKTEMPKADDQIKEGIRQYVERRYQWEPSTVTKKLKDSEVFISPLSLKAFQNAVMNVAKFSIDKIVSQKVYADKIDIDLKKQTALITGDRVTTIQGLKAAGNLKLELTFENGPRTVENPWGLYISKEREE